MKESKYLHIIAFNVPYPPNYGGIIDIYYKLKALHENGLKIVLHAFLYERETADALKAVTDEIYYYKRKAGLRFFLNRLPYIVITRQSGKLKKRLLKDAHPVLFEGLHTSLLLKKCRAAGKKVIVRTHNIEHNYYNMLSKSERRPFKKIFFLTEARKLKKYEQILHHAHHTLAISKTDQAYFRERYGNSIYVSAFHQHNSVSCSEGKGDYILFHGDLSVPENENALVYLVNTVLSLIDYKVLIAGRDPSSYVRNKCSSYEHIELVSNPSEEQMQELVSNAHINLLYTYQPTGLKLKLLHSLYGGRHCLANPLMLSGSGLDKLCTVYRNPVEAKEKIDYLMARPFLQNEIEKRKKTLENYQNTFNAQKIIDLL